jgi:hypothetical protein
MPRARDGGSCVDPAETGGRLGEGRAEEAVEREGEESSRAWHASEQYIRLWKDVMRLDNGIMWGGQFRDGGIYLSRRMGLPH